MGQAGFSFPSPPTARPHAPRDLLASCERDGRAPVGGSQRLLIPSPQVWYSPGLSGYRNQPPSTPTMCLEHHCALSAPDLPARLWWLTVVFCLLPDRLDLAPLLLSWSVLSPSASSPSFLCSPPFVSVLSEKQCSFRPVCPVPVIVLIEHRCAPPISVPPPSPYSGRGHGQT